MNLTFLLPLGAGVVLYLLAGITNRSYIKTKLETFTLFSIFCLLFGTALMTRMISLISTTYVDLYIIHNLCYINAAVLLALFIDLVSKGHITWKSLLVFFCAGGLSVSQIFLDEYIIIYSELTGWTTILTNLIHFGVFVLYYGFIIFFILGGYLIRIYRENSGWKKVLLKRIIIVFLITGSGVTGFYCLRILNLIGNPLLRNLDTVCIVIGFGYLIQQYLQHPSAFHLDMVDIKLYGLYVYDKLSGILLYSYEFEVAKFEKKQLISGFLKGVDDIFKEILASQQELKEIVHGSNIILFNEGPHISVGLITNSSTILTKNWLYQFRNKFEKTFPDEIKKYISKGTNFIGTRPDPLVKRIFHH